MIIAGYIASIFIGISLGLIGGGGSILTVPVLVYLFGVDPVLSTAYSLFIVGLTALVGGIRATLSGDVDLKTAGIFAVPAFIAVFLTRSMLIPMLPDTFFALGSFVMTKQIAIMIFFSIIMLAAALSMIFNKKPEKEDHEEIHYNYPMILIEGFVVGILTGIVGAGGGFLIIPALVLFAGLPMKKAVGTSLLIIAAKSLIGFLGDIESGQAIDYGFMAIISLIATAGIFVGFWLSQFVSGKRLKSIFGYFVLIVGIYIIIRETILK